MIDRTHASPPDLSRLDPASLPYLRALPEFLKRTDSRLWEWFHQSVRDPKAAEEARFELLKSTYRVDREVQPALHQTIEEVAGELGISAPIALYQAQNPQGLNASLAAVPGEIHLVFHGPVTAQLTPLEVRGLVGHELAHHLLLEEAGGELVTTGEMLGALLNDPHAHPAHFASWRLLQLYGEIFCDRGAYLAAGDLLAVVSMLVKVHTGVEEVSPEAYLRQADEIFARRGASSEEITHPEAFIRARALRLWVEGAAETAAAIERMIEGEPSLDDLDLLAQERVAAGTRQVLDRLLWRRWLQTDAVLAHARLFFDDYVPPPGPVEFAASRPVPLAPESLSDYVCFVLLDFAAADRELDEAPLAAALEVAEQLGLKPRFAEIAGRELRLRKNQVEKIDARRAEILLAADRTVAPPP